MKTLGYIISISISFAIINLACQPAQPEQRILTDSDVRDIVEAVLLEMYNPENLAEDVELHMSRFPEFYDLYSTGIIRDQFYSDDYWVDFGAYLQPLGHHSVTQYHYIYILPRYSNGTFFIATNYYYNRNLEYSGDRENNFEIFECRREDLVDIKYSLLHDSDPEISDYRSLGGFKIQFSDTGDEFSKPTIEPME